MSQSSGAWTGFLDELPDMEEPDMALKTGETNYCLLSVEGERTRFNRKLTQLRIQDRFGRMHIVTGDSLPDLFVVQLRQEKRGGSIAEILLNNKPTEKLPFWPEIVPWPSGRDAIQWIGGLVVGMFLLGLLDAVANAVR